MADTQNIFANSLDVGQKVYNRLQQQDEDRAKIQAGRQLATGDYTGGAATLNSAGMIDPAHNVLADQQVLQDRKTTADDLAQDRAKKAQADRLTGLSKLTDAVQAVPVGQRAAWLKTQLPTLQQMGLPVDQLANLNEAQLTDDALKPWKAALGNAKLRFEKVGNDTLAIDEGTGNVSHTYRGNITAKKDETVYAPDDPGYGTPAGAPQAAPAAVAPAAAPTLAPIPASAPAGARGVRNNNPLNITGQGWNGQTGSDGRFATFQTPEAGFAAADRNLITYNTKHGINTLSGIINRWAPAGDGDNNPQSYIQTVAKDTGIDPNAPLNLADPKVRAIVLHSMSKVELGGSGSATRTAATAPQGAPAAPILAGGAAGDDLGQAPKGYHLLMSGPKDPEEAPLTDSAIKLQAGMYLKSGQMPPLGMGKAAHADRVRIMNEMDSIASSLGLNADDIVSGTISMKAAAKGLDAATKIRSQVEGSEETVNKNAQLALSLAPKGGGPTGMPVLNRVIQHIRGQYAGDPDVAAYEAAIGTVAEEYSKVMTTNTGTGGATSDSARKTAYDRLSTASTLPQLKQVISTLQTEMQNRATSLRDVEEGLRGQVRGANSAAPPAPAAAPAPAPGGGWSIKRVN